MHDREKVASDFAVVAHKLSKSYVSGGITNRKKTRALDEVSFAIETGESVGLFGRNGSGKSTLTKLIAGAEEPTSGTVLVSSQPSLLGVSAALKPHLTGIQNAELGLLAQGFSPSEVSDLKHQVVDAAEIGSASLRPMNTYSSGMAARLKFAIATARPSKILLIDEALATGDASFQSKSESRMESILQSSGTIFLVSHVVSTVERLCNRALWLHDGHLIADGPVDEIGPRYRDWASYSSMDDEKSAAVIIREAKTTFAPLTIQLSVRNRGFQGLFT